MVKLYVIVLVLFVFKEIEAQNKTDSTAEPIDKAQNNAENTTTVQPSDTTENLPETTTNIPETTFNDAENKGQNNTSVNTTIADDEPTTPNDIENSTVGAVDTTPVPKSSPQADVANSIGSTSTEKPKHGKHIVFVNGGSCKLAKAITNFGIIFLNHVLEDNTVFSPLLIANSLAVLQQGSYGDTESQISSALNMSARESSINFQWMLEKINDINDTENNVNIASGLFISQDASEINPTFKDNVKNFFDTDVKIIKFKNSSYLINDWVRNKTKGKIMEIVETGELDDYDELVLLSMAHFKGNWKLPTESDTNILKPFYYKNRSRKVPFIRTKGYYRYGSDYSIASKIVILPDNESRNVLTIILPNKGISLNAILSSLQTDHLTKYFRFPQKLLTIEIPKLSLKANIDVEPILSQFGVLDVFNDDSELSNIEADTERVLEATLFKHKAEFSLDFKKVRNPNGSKRYRIRETFVADRPFIAILTDKESLVPLFFAKVEKPVK